MAEKRLQVLNRDAIKYIAMLTMLLNHIAHVFLERGTPLYEIFEDIGFFTAPVMCFFLVEGYTYTHSKKGYGLRLMLFAALSQIPFQLAFGYSTLNMIYTLLCCFLILVIMEKVSSPFLCRGLILLLILATVNGDWAVVAPILTILLANDWGDRKMMARDFGLTYFLFALLNMQSYMNGEPGNWTLYAVIHALLSGLGVLAAAVATLVLYNGERAEHGRTFSKWFFYLFYPGHLLILYLIKISLHNI
ncbi:MAG: conjugal transfer protein TraX [Lachnospiraceae bacterium]|nr:conjugal transfer protein TraX [Lachnospiraceae bacterium]